MSTPIVQISVSVQVAPTPDTLQKTGAAISQGGTNLAPGTVGFITELSDLTPLYNSSKAIASITWSSGLATVTTSTPHGLTNGDVVPVTLAGQTPIAYAGNVNATATGASTFTFPLASNPGTNTAPGVYTFADVAELCAMFTTFFAQGANQAGYVLELGPGTPAEGAAALTAFLIANANVAQPLDGSLPSRFYSYLVPREWAAEATFHALCQSYNSPSAKLWFFVTSTLANYQTFTVLDKCCWQLIEAPNLPPTEFSIAACWRASLSYRPSATNKVSPFAFTYVYGVTPYPKTGNAAQLNTLKNAGVNIIGTGAEGGIANTMIQWGTGRDLNDFTFWYSADWIQINLDLSIANAIINGSNNPINPLYYDQDGINRLQGVIADVFNRGVKFGLVLFTATQTALDGPALDDAINAGTYAGSTVINAVPFITYSQENPGDYKLGVYSGFSGEYVPKRGFIAINFSLVVSFFVAA